MTSATAACTRSRWVRAGGSSCSAWRAVSRCFAHLGQFDDLRVERLARPVLLAPLCFDAAPFHLHHVRPQVRGRGLFQALRLEAAVVDARFLAGPLQMPVGGLLPQLPKRGDFLGDRA